MEADRHESRGTGLIRPPLKIILETERLILREVVAADANFMQELVNDPNWITYIGQRNVFSLADATEFIRTRFEETYRSKGIGLWLVEQKSTGVSIGICGLVDRPALDDIDLGYAFLPRFRSSGFAFEAAQACLTFGREKLQLTRIVAITSPENKPSCSLLEKLGFHAEGLMTLPDEQDALQLFALE